MEVNDVDAYHYRYGGWFRRGVEDNTAKSCEYLKGLFSYGKSNIERMAEQLSVNEQQLHHFVSVSDWDAKAVMGQVAEEMEKTFMVRQQAKGLLIEESSWSKKGSKSVGVAKQYLGSIGRTDNGQVAGCRPVVFAAMAQDRQVGLVDAELYLPKVWTAHEQRMKPEFLKIALRIKQRLH